MANRNAPWLPAGTRARKGGHKSLNDAGCWRPQRRANAAVTANGGPNQAFWNAGTHGAGSLEEPGLQMLLLANDWIASPRQQARRVQTRFVFWLMGFPAEVGLQRIGGNAIVPPLAARSPPPCALMEAA